MAILNDTQINGSLNVTEDIQIGNVSVTNTLNNLSVVINKNTNQKTTSVASGTDTVVDSFTIPNDGIYYFSASFTATSNASGKYVAMVMKSNNDSTWTPLEVSGVDGYLRMNGSCILQCTKGENCVLHISHNNGSALSVNTRFEVVQLMKL